MNYCIKLRKIRKDLGLSQSEFADLLGITQGHLSSIEKGDRGLTVEISQKISATFHISLDWLLMDNGEAPSRVELIKQYEESLANNARLSA